MSNKFLNCFSAEWIKARRSFSSWLVLIGGFFIPFISILIFLIYPNQLLSLHASVDFWKNLFERSWQLMAFMLLPMGIVLAVSLIMQLEYKNNCWKQLHCTPVPFYFIYFSKLLMLLVMLIKFFLVFNLGIYLSAVIPSLLNRNIRFPSHTIDEMYFLKQNTNYFVMCLPMVSLQYLISLHFKNILIPVGIGLALVFGSLIALSWKYNYMLPTSYTAVYFLQQKSHAQPLHNLPLWSLWYFLIFMFLGYWLYIFKKEKG